MADPNVVLSAIEPGLIAAAWPHLAPHFVRACSRVLTDWSPDKIRAEAEAGHLSLWAISDIRSPLPFLGALATALKTVRGEKVVVFAVLGGREMHRWLEYLVAEIEQFAKSHGATRAEIEGRLGWLPQMRSLGYRPARVVLQKVL